jgi:hypothetical protein
MERGPRAVHGQGHENPGPFVLFMLVRQYPNEMQENDVSTALRVQGPSETGVKDRALVMPKPRIVEFGNCQR